MRTSTCGRSGRLADGDALGSYRQMSTRRNLTVKGLKMSGVVHADTTQAELAIASFRGGGKGRDGTSASLAANMGQFASCSAVNSLAHLNASRRDRSMGRLTKVQVTPPASGKRVQLGKYEA